MSPEQLEAKLHHAAGRLRQPSELMAKIGNVALAGGKKRTPVRTGTLRRSEGMRSDASSATLYASANYAEYVHFGTSRMAARPFFNEGVADSLGQIESIAAQYGATVLSEVSG